MKATYQEIEAFEDRGEYVDGLAYIDGERAPAFDVDYDGMERDPECLGKIHGMGVVC